MTSLKANRARFLRRGADYEELKNRGSSGRDILLGVGGGLLLLSFLGVAEARAEVVGRVSVSTAGAQATDDSYSGDLSGNGRFVAFTSDASNLVRGDTNGEADLFVRDRELRVTTRVNVGPGGVQANERAMLVTSISRDGRFVAFTSSATNLVAGDTEGSRDVFVHDRRTRATRRVSVASDGTPANGQSWGGPLSADGRFVAFYSGASNLVPGDTNFADDVFVHELATGRTERVSVGAGGVQGGGYSVNWGAGISADGRFVAFHSEASNLVPGDTNGQRDVFLRDRRAGTTERVSAGPRGRQGDEVSYGGEVSADGRFVAFYSAATNLVAGDTNGVMDIFVRDRGAGRTTRVSTGPRGVQADAQSEEALISADGRRVVFSSYATNLVPGDTNGDLDVFVHDRGTGATRRVSVGPGGAQASVDEAPMPAISDDGGLVTFSSRSASLWPRDTNNQIDVFVARTR